VNNRCDVNYIGKF